MSLMTSLAVLLALLSSASATPAPLTGTSGVKMSGPYDYVPPLYWFHPHAQSLTLGVGFSYNTETSPGPAIPTIESLKKFLPADKLWPINEAWSTHAGGNERPRSRGLALRLFH